MSAPAAAAAPAAAEMRASGVVKAAARSAADKLAALRALMRDARLAAYVVPTADAHNSEYVCERDQRRTFISGFTGSAGTAVVTTDHGARLWTDGRYYLQASTELDAGAGWQLMKDRLPETPTIEAWLAATLARGDAVGVDPFTFTYGAVKRMRPVLEAAGLALATSAVSPEAGGTPAPNLVDAVWGAEQPPAPAARVWVHEDAHAGATVGDKLAAIRAALAKEGAQALVLAALDEVAWAFNIRGGDVECNPVSIAYGLVTADGGATLCIDDAKLDDAARAHLAASGVAVAPYEAAPALARALPGRVWLDPASVNYALYQQVVEGGDAKAGAGSSAVSPPSGRVLEKMSPVQLLKAVKNPVEAAGMRAAHVRDGAALTGFLSWLEAAVTRGVDLRHGPDARLDFPLTESSAGAVLDGMRAAVPGFVSLSFPTIAGMGANGAIIHYRAQPGADAPVTADGTFLLDSGGQYVDGTTDVTRTLHFGAPTPHQRRCFTRVLQGFIALGSAVFPPGTSGIALDALARAPLWRDGLDYRHGTGHGVGCCLNVHEGPQYAASAARSAYDGGLVAGMTLTDEPGVYLDGELGIRVENVLLAVEAPRADVPHAFGGKPYLTWEHMTVVPITPRLVEPALLAPAEREWLNAYNARVRATLEPHLAGHALDYLRRETEPV